ncbi:hypothetical protein SDC9_48749 [bioreactor metagenome]|uniref:Pantothenates transporter PanS n=1 Tax=bioreactor metagenome TaxID=1076179 RepID=A0A644WFA2_9ZZZZ
MINKAFKILNDRNFILISAILLGFILGTRTTFLSKYSVWILAMVMIFATSGFSFMEWRHVGKTFRIIGLSFLLNYVILGILLIASGFLLFENKIIITGIILLAISPPGPSVIPFTSALKGNISFAVTGVFGLNLIAIIVTPLSLLLFAGESDINPQKVISIILMVIVAPLIISRVLRRTPIMPAVEKVRGKVINWGFFFIILPIVGMSKALITNNPEIVLLSSLLFAVVMFGGGFLFNRISEKSGMDKQTSIAASFMFTSKSSAFAAVISFSLLPPESGLPLAINSVFLALYFIIFNFLVNKKSKKELLKQII